MSKAMTTLDRLRPNADWAKSPLLNQKEWKAVRFGDVVVNLNETCDPEHVGLDRFIGLEHLEPGSLHVRTWGNVADGVTFNRRCRPGQVLFGKRRAYQRKVAVAEFDAVVSGDIYVLAPKNDRLLPELLPFLCLSERFFQHAVGTSAGSLSPRTNWSSLASFEFDLPPLDQQHRMAKLLLAVDEVHQLYESAADAAELLVEAELGAFLRSGSWPTNECGNLLHDGPKNGYSPPASAEARGLPTLSISAVRDGRIVAEGNLKYAAVRKEDVEQFMLRPKDILVVRGNGNKSLCGRAGIVQTVPAGCFYPDLLIRLRFFEHVFIPEFAVMQWNERKTHARLLSRAKSTNGIWKINGKDIRSHTLATPPIVEQRQFLDRVTKNSAIAAALDSSKSAMASLQSTIINTVFERQL